MNQKADFLQNESIRIDSHNESNRIANWNALLRTRYRESSFHSVVFYEQAMTTMVVQYATHFLALTCRRSGHFCFRSFDRLQHGSSYAFAILFTVLCYRQIRHLSLGHRRYVWTTVDATAEGRFSENTQINTRNSSYMLCFIVCARMALSGKLSVSSLLLITRDTGRLWKVLIINVITHKQFTFSSVE